MEIIKSENIQEEAYIEKLENGLTVLIFPRQTTNKKYVIWGTRFGSIDNHFKMPNTGEEVTVPDGVAHFLEHKMFEQPNGTNSLDTLMALGVDANAYTTNDHTAYLFECTDHFEEALAELMDYVQHPYFTYENVEKEKGIIGQEIQMYEDDPGWQLYMNAMDCLYKNNPIKIDTAGTKETISHIDKDILYKCYNTFYHPSNMMLVLCGNFKPEEIIETVKGHLVDKGEQGDITRYYPEKDKEINKKEKIVSLEVSTPIFMIGILDTEEDRRKSVKEHMAIEIALNIVLGTSSNLYKELYEKGILSSQPDFDYEFSNEYAHILVAGQSKNPKEIYKRFKEEIRKVKEEGILEEDFERCKKKLYGNYVSEYNDIDAVARMFLADWIKGNNSFDYIEKYNQITKEYVEEIIKNKFDEDKMIISIAENVNESK